MKNEVALKKNINRNTNLLYCKHHNINKVTKNFFITLLIVIIFNYCNEIDNNENVLIKSKNDTIKINEIFEAGLYIIHTDSIFPDFYIVSKGDTSLLPYDENKKCAIFRAVGRYPGKKTYKGYVEYRKDKEKVKKRSFQINYFVK